MSECFRCSTPHAPVKRCPNCQKLYCGTCYDIHGVVFEGAVVTPCIAIPYTGWDFEHKEKKGNQHSGNKNYFFREGIDL